MSPVWFNWATVCLLIIHGAAQNFQSPMFNGNLPVIVPLPTNNNLHSHASVSHAHNGQTQHAHNNLPLTDQPNSPTHRHGSMVHSHSGAPVHSHANVQQSIDVQQLGNVHRHGSMSHSHGGPAIHYHPNLPTSSHNLNLNTRHHQAGAQGVIDNQNTHSHGSVVHSHGGPRVHSHPNLPVSGTDNLNTQNRHSHGSTIHTHEGPKRNSHTNMHNSMSNAHQTEPRSHGSTVHSHPERQGHHHSNNLGTATDINQNGQQTHGSVVHADGGQNGHAHPNLQHSNMNHRLHQNLNRMDVLTGTPRQWHRQNFLNNNVNLPRDEAFRQLLQTRGFLSTRQNRRPIRPNYQLAGGASCQSQCQNSLASRSCYCARYMCYYQGCSSNCELIQEGTNVRAECQQSRTVASNNPNTPRCQQPIDPGTCNSRLYTRYAFNSHSRTCARFIYSGCGGNENRFTSRNACMNSCAL